jgi:hypothetical protein
LGIAGVIDREGLEVNVDLLHALRSPAVAVDLLPCSDTVPMLKEAEVLVLVERVIG